MLNNYTGRPMQSDGGFGHRDWSIRELHRAAGWSENFIYGLIRSGEITAYKRGNRTSIVGQSIDDYRERNRVQPDAMVQEDVA